MTPLLWAFWVGARARESAIVLVLYGGARDCKLCQGNEEEALEVGLRFGT